MDYCALATARSIPVAQEIATRFDELKMEHDIGHLQIKISGCINACGHHHVGHIGILGLDRAGVENYQITLGGDATETAAIGTRTGPGFAYDEIVPAVERIVEVYMARREGPEETFLETYNRIGMGAKGLFGIVEDLGAEAATHIRRHHPHLVFRQAQHEGAHQQADHMPSCRPAPAADSSRGA